MYFLAIADIYKHREFVANNYMYIKKVWLTEQFFNQNKPLCGAQLYADSQKSGFTRPE